MKASATVSPCGEWACFEFDEHRPTEDDRGPTTEAGAEAPALNLNCGNTPL
jgi:hypothetical protein